MLRLLLLFIPSIALATGYHNPGNPTPPAAVNVPNVNNLVVNNSVRTTATVNGTGTSTSKGISVSEISAAKTPVLSIQASTVGHAENISTGAGAGSAATTAQIGGTAANDLGVGKGIVGVNVTGGTLAATNQSADIATAGRATVDAKVVNGVLTETKTAISQAVGSGNVTGSANAAGAFSNIGLPQLPAIGLH